MKIKFWMALAVLCAIIPIANAAQYIGLNTTTTPLSGIGDGQPVIVYQVFSASGSGTLTTMSVNIPASALPLTVALGIYNSTGTTLLGSTGSVSAVSGTNTISLSAGVAVTSGTSYTLAIFINGYAAYYTDGTTTSLKLEKDLTGFPTFPASLTASTTRTDGVVGVFGSGSATSTSTYGFFFGSIAQPNPHCLRVSSLPMPRAQRPVEHREKSTGVIGIGQRQRLKSKSPRCA